MQPDQTLQGWIVTRTGACLALAPAPGRVLTPAAAQALSAVLNTWARDADLYAVAFTPALLELTLRDIDDDAGRAVAELIWRLDCFSKPIVSLMSGAVGDIGLAFALAGTHRVATSSAAFALSAPAQGRIPPGNVIRTLASLDGKPRWCDIVGGAPVDATEALALDWVTHVVAGDDLAAIRDGLAAALPVDPLCDDRHVSPIRARRSDQTSPAAVSPTIVRALESTQHLAPQPAIEQAQRYDVAVRLHGADAAFDAIAAAAQALDISLPDRRALQAFRNAT